MHPYIPMISLCLLLQIVPSSPPFSPLLSLTFQFRARNKTSLCSARFLSAGEGHCTREKEITRYKALAEKWAKECQRNEGWMGGAKAEVKDLGSGLSGGRRGSMID